MKARCALYDSIIKPTSNVLPQYNVCKSIVMLTLNEIKIENHFIYLMVIECR